MLSEEQAYRRGIWHNHFTAPPSHVGSQDRAAYLDLWCREHGIECDHSWEARALHMMIERKWQADPNNKRCVVTKGNDASIIYRSSLAAHLKNGWVELKSKGVD